MTGKNNQLPELINEFLTSYVQQYQKKYQHLPLVEHDEQWPSPCLKGKHSVDGYDYWQPNAIEDSIDFINVEQALELTLHQDIKTFFTEFYSDVIDAEHEQGKLQLLFAWSKDDFERLQQNLIGHILTKRRLKQPETVFFAVTDQEDFILSVENDTGAVWVEQVGKVPHIKLADSLAEFIQQLTVVLP